MTKLCPNCQYSNPDTNTKCEVCGQDLLSDLPGNSTNHSISGTNILRGLKLLRNGYLIFILEFVLGITLGFILLRTFSIDGILGPLGTLSSARSLSSFSSSITDIIIVILIDVAISVAAYIFIYKGLKELSHLKPTVRTGATGAILVIVGLLLVVIFAVIAATSFSTISSTSSSLSVSTHLTGVVILGTILLAIGAILLIVGIIMLTIGLFRVGSAFSSGSVEAGAIIAIFLSIIGYIILILGINGIISRISKAKDNTQGS